MTWLNRLLISAPKFCLCVNERQFKRELKRLGITQRVDFVLGTTPTCATCHFMRGPEDCVIVTLRIDPKTPKHKVLALLVHEAVHIWQETKRHYTETNPGDEIEAYCIQGITESLFEAYFKLVK